MLIIESQTQCLPKSPERFADIAVIAIFDSGILDREEICNRASRVPGLWADYIAYKALGCACRKSHELKMVLLIAQHIYRSHYEVTYETGVFTGAVTNDQLTECVLEVCKMATHPYPSGAFESGKWLVSAAAAETEHEVDESSLCFRRHLLSAAVGVGDKRLVLKLVGEGCNHSELGTQ